jgi:voltage-gated potassium channel Kch
MRGDRPLDPPPAAANAARASSVRARRLLLGSAATGAFLVLMGLLSATDPTRSWYLGPFAGYDPPFDVISGMILLVLSPRLGARSAIGWVLSLIAPVLCGVIAVLSPNEFSIAAAVAAAVLLVFVYPHRPGFFRRTSPGPEIAQSGFAVASLLAVLFGMVGARWLGAQFSPPPGIQNWGEALYFTVATISTIGASYVPVTESARWFVVFLILVGVGTFLTAIVVLFGPLVEQRLERISERIERSQMMDLDHHVIVCGASPEAQATARSLRDDGVVVVILSAEARAIDLLKGEGFRAHLGDPASEEELKTVGIDHARAVVVSQESDAANLLTVITARALQPRLRIVAVAAAESTLPKLLRAGANEAISVVAVAARLVSQSALASDSGPASGRAPATSG